MYEHQRTNSIMSDPEPITSPEVKAPPKARATGWQKLAKGQKYAEVTQWIAKKREYYQSFAPGNIPVEQLNEKDRSTAWGQSVVAIRLLDELENMIEVNGKKHEPIQLSK